MQKTLQKINEDKKVCNCFSVDFIDISICGFLFTWAENVLETREKTDSRYSLVILTAKRARDIVDGKPALTEEESERPVSQAAKEIAADMITYTRREEE